MQKFVLVLLAVLSGLTWAELNLKRFCADKNLNKVAAHPQDCRGYIVCSDEPFVYYCEEGFHFDSKRLICNLPENANCQLMLSQLNEKTVDDIEKPVYTSLMALDVITGEIVDPMMGYQPSSPVCRHLGAYFLPNPTHCRSYYLCAYGHMHEHSCGKGTLWNYKTEQCVLSHKAICYQLSEEEENEINESLTNLELCYAANTSTLATTNTTSNNQATVNSSVTIETTTLPMPPMLTETSTTSVPSRKPNPNLPSNPYYIMCPPRRQSYVAHPQDCSKYFMCILGTPVMTSCPEGLLWDTRKEYCDFGKNVKCFSKK